MDDAQLAAAIDAAFTYHPPNESQVHRYEAIRGAAKKLALGLNDLAPGITREKLIALDKLRECTYWINAAIAVNEADHG